jgi:hypothetical protein
LFCTGENEVSNSKVKEYRLRVLEKQGYRRAKKNESTGERRKLYNLERVTGNTLRKIIRVIRSTGYDMRRHVARMENEHAYIILAGNPQGNTSVRKQAKIGG